MSPTNVTPTIVATRESCERLTSVSELISACCVHSQASSRATRAGDHFVGNCSTQKCQHLYWYNMYNRYHGSQMFMHILKDVVYTVLSHLGIVWELQIRNFSLHTVSVFCL